MPSRTPSPTMAPRASIRISPQAREAFHRLAERYGPEHLPSDPVQYVHRYETPEDREIVGLVAALLAFGNARSVCASIESLLPRLGRSPSETAKRLARPNPPRWRGPLHRWVRAADMARFLGAVGRLRAAEGSLESAFLSGDEGGEDLSRPLASFVGGLRRHMRGPKSRGANYLLVSPEGGSACKRWNMWLRWMVRPADGIDLGLWTRVDPRRLTVPLDTHVARIGRYLGLTRRRSTDWKAAREITRSLREVDASDPTRFDFALARLGILDRCPRRRDPRKCRACDLFEMCTLA